MTLIIEISGILQYEWTYTSIVIVISNEMSNLVKGITNFGVRVVCDTYKMEKGQAFRSALLFNYAEDNSFLKHTFYKLVHCYIV